MLPTDRSSEAYADTMPMGSTEEAEARLGASAAAERRAHSRWPRLLLAALLALLAVELGATLVQHLRVPSETDWQAASKAVRRDWRRYGDALLFAPAWVDPLGRQHLGDLLTLESASLSDVDRFSRVYQVSVRGGVHPFVAGLRPSSTDRFGGVTVTRYDKPAEKVTYSFYHRLGEAQVERAGPTPARCVRQPHPYGATRIRFVCDDRASWNWVGQHLAEVNHRPYHCIYAHPFEGHRMRVTFPNVPRSRRLVVYTGLDDFENRKKSKAPVTLEVFVGERRVGQIRHDSDSPWRRTELGFGETSGAALHPVRFEVTTDLAYARTFCFTAEARN
ncbi:MAG: hypothetical protein IT371_06400 [Deltaproteobacteria bacterium]|nr:hypothetical protein [Deltaproteobacteria bacterium]